MAQYRSSIEQECLAYQSLQSPESSYSDLVQEVALRVWERIAQFKGLEAAGDESFRNLRFEAWLRKTARSILNNLYRERRTLKRSAASPVQSIDLIQDVAAASQSPSSIFGHIEEHLRVRSVLNEKLDGVSREVVLLHISKDFTFQAIADQLGMTYDQVRHKYRAAMKQMENELT
jgi:RNA polymerase sigma factor (sigma-70 family)